jgi:hypothetical protein
LAKQILPLPLRSVQTKISLHIRAVWPRSTLFVIKSVYIFF